MRVGIVGGSIAGCTSGKDVFVRTEEVVATGTQRSKIVRPRVNLALEYAMGHDIANNELHEDGTHAAWIVVRFSLNNRLGAP